MKLPYPYHLDVIPIQVHVSAGIGVNGEPKTAAIYRGKCFFDEKAKTMRTADGQLVQLTGFVSIGEDVAPQVKEITGFVLLNGIKYRIHLGRRLRNPDGTIHHTELELI